MSADAPLIVPLLKKIHLFSGLNDLQLQALAERFELIRPDAGTRIIRQGDPGDDFYMILRGGVNVFRETKTGNAPLAHLGSNDYFGEEALLTGRSRSASVEVEGQTTLVRVTGEEFRRMLRKHPPIASRLKLIMRSRQMSRRLAWDWLNKDETIYLIERKHIFILILRLLFPAGVIGLGLISFMLANMTSFTIFAYAAWVILAIGLVWGVWNYLDWGNDYYIVTNQRIIETYKIIALYDSRNEAPLYAIQSIGIESDFWQRLLGFGDVLIRTFTGQVSMADVSDPTAIRDLVSEHWDRSKGEERSKRLASLDQQLTKDLGLNTNVNAGAGGGAAHGAGAKPKARPGWLDDIIMMRYVQGDAITYRKHWAVLLYQVALPTLAFIAVLLVGIFIYQNWIVIAAVQLVPLGWWIYQYVDWRNDIYRVTKDKIFDIDRKPLGREEKKEAPIKNILSLEVERKNLIGILLNFGNVVIDVSGTRFTFDNIFDPNRAQQEIFQRLDDLRHSEDLQKALNDRRTVVETLQSYERIKKRAGG